MNFFWPTHPKPFPGLVARLGRLLHLVGLALAAAVFVTECYSSEHPIVPGLIVAVPVALLARGLRYVLAAE